LVTVFEATLTATLVTGELDFFAITPLPLEEDLAATLGVALLGALALVLVAALMGAFVATLAATFVADFAGAFTGAFADVFKGVLVETATAFFATALTTFCAFLVTTFTPEAPLEGDALEGAVLAFDFALDFFMLSPQRNGLGQRLKDHPFLSSEQKYLNKNFLLQTQH
jgi:ABC-type phosphate transport system permease subunit